MLDLDPPDHTRLRGLVHQAFTPRLVEQLRGRVQAITDELLTAAARRGRFDLIADFALPLPATVIAELLGVPASDQRRFHRWSSHIVSMSSARDFFRAAPSAWSFVRYLRGLIERRRSAPGSDLLSALVQTEEAGDKLSRDELLAMGFLLLVAGHETTVNLIGNGVLELLRHPDQLQALRDDPALLRSGVEELLRYSSPVQIATERWAKEDTVLQDSVIPRGAQVLAILAAANRDERQFPNPDVLDVRREPNRHVAFGQGIHYCLGAPLARLEGQIALGALLERFPQLRLAAPPESLRWRRGLFLRGLHQLPVAV